MSAPVVKGWCPGALRPMLSGDGWLVRIRPPMGQLTPAQAVGVGQAALKHGNGVIDLSSRANLQLRGVREEAHATLINDLRELGLVDNDADAEAARNLVITPFRDDITNQIAANLMLAFRGAPVLPGKFGFAVDTGSVPVLGSVSADIRLERERHGGLILRADGMNSGMLVTESTAAAAAIDLARWFITSQGVMDGRGRMAGVIARGVVPDGHVVPALAGTVAPSPGECADGMVVAFAFGQMQAETLIALGDCDHTLILTPWRMILMLGAQMAPDDAALITRADDSLLHVTACTGAPGCPQAHGQTRALARELAPLTTGRLHVSGCTKGCAHPGKADLTLVATPKGYDLIRGGAASDTPHLRNLQPHQIPDVLHAP
ncbi:MAG: precorrin-3B synthase [Paracoccaceae bacterium]